MSAAISPYFTFPPVNWWASVSLCHEVGLDEEEVFRKMTSRNRYRIATANGVLQLSIPLQGGRSQRVAMKDVEIDNKQNWQKQHWGALFSAYGRSPFYEYYGPELEDLIKKESLFLKDFNMRAISWAASKLRLTTVFSQDVPPVDHIIRLQDGKMSDPTQVIPYPQVFEDRYGFLDNLSIIDLLMNEGPASSTILRDMARSVS